jgi:hypothetical protein
MKRKVIRLTEAQLRQLVAEMFDSPPADSWTQLGDALAAVKRTVQGLQGEMAAASRVDPARGNVAHSAKAAQASIRRLQAIVDRMVDGAGSGA